MKRTLLVLGMVLALAMTSMAASGDHEYPDPRITSPTAGDVVYENFLYLEAKVIDLSTDGFEYPRWSLRASSQDMDPTCIAETDVAGNVRGLEDPSTVLNEDFTASVDISGLTGGEYCFAINQGAPGDVSLERDVVFFYIVDEYAKVGGNVDNAGYLKGFNSNLDLKELRGRQLSHAFEGVVGNAGSAGTVGSIEVNYRQLDTQCTFTPGGLALSTNDPGIALDGLRANLTGFDGSCTDASTTSSANIFLLDKDADSNRDAPRGAVVLRWIGNPSMSEYEIDGTPGTTGPDSWISLENGNVEVGTR